MIIDMHTHTNYSDGLYGPEELIDLAIEKNLSGIAITDHDSIDALNEANLYAKTKEDFILIPGIEFGCEYDHKEVHLLGYFIDYNNLDLISLIKRLKKSRIERGKKMVGKLVKLGFELDIKDVRKFAKDDYIGRPHIARALIEKNYVEDINEAFEIYLKKGAKAYVDRFKLSIKESIQLIEKVNGISILAHPGLIGDKDTIDHVISLGVDGIECYHSKHSREDTTRLLQLAKRKELIISGGSDYHGDVNILGNNYIDFNDSPELKRRLENV